MSAIDSLGVLQQSAVDKVASVFLDDVEQAEAELQLRDKLEVRQVYVAPHADLEIDIERLEAQGIVLAGCEVDHRIDACDDVRAEVIVARRSELQVERHRNVCALEDLCTVCPTLLLVIDGVLLSEMDCWRKAERQVLVDLEGTKHTDRKAWAVVVYLCIPLLARCRVDVAIVLQLDVLHVQAQEEAIMKPPLVDIRAILHLALLCHKAQGEGKDKKGDEAPQNVCAHRINNVTKGRFIAQIIVFGDKGEKKSRFAMSLSLKKIIFALENKQNTNQTSKLRLWLT